MNVTQRYEHNMFDSLSSPTKSFKTTSIMTTIHMSSVISILLLVIGVDCAMRVQQFSPIVPVIAVSTVPALATSNSNSLIPTVNPQNQHHYHQAAAQRCPAGVPPQWRPHLDAASKAHLAPGVALATLQHLSVVPVQVSALGQQQAAPTQPSIYHPQNINNAGVTIEATFTVSAVIKRSNPALMLQPNQTVKLLYRISAALSTMNLSLPLGISGNQLYGAAGRYSKANDQSQPQMKKQQPGSGRRFAPGSFAQQQVPACAFDLSEHELAKEAKKMFKLHKSYILFLDQVASVANNQRLKQLLVAPATGVPQNPTSTATQKATTLDTEREQFNNQQQLLYPLATHTPLTNQTSRALSKILCKNCVAQVPQVQLVNATFVSVSATTQQRGSQNNNNGPMQQQQQPTRIKLDCRVTGYPAPWVQWFKNGKLLRNSGGGGGDRGSATGNGRNSQRSDGSNNSQANSNKAKGARWFVQTSKWKGRHNVFLSRLELDLRVGRNETGIYECRAMSVVAREPAVGTYTLLVLPTSQYALIPMQPLATGTQRQQQQQQRMDPSLVDNSVASESSSPDSGSPTKQVVVQQQEPSSISNPVQRHRQQEEQRINGGTTAQVELNSAATSGPADGGGNEQSAPSSSSPSSSNRSSPAQGPQINNNNNNNTGTAQVKEQQQQQELSKGQQCSSEMQDILCHNKGTCIKIVIGTTEELGCKCAEGYLGRRCEFKLTRHSDNVDPPPQPQPQPQLLLQSQLQQQPQPQYQDPTATSNSAPPTTSFGQIPANEASLAAAAVGDVAPSVGDKAQ